MLARALAIELRRDCSGVAAGDVGARAGTGAGVDAAEAGGFAFASVPSGFFGSSATSSPERALSLIEDAHDKRQHVYAADAHPGSETQTDGQTIVYATSDVADENR